MIPETLTEDLLERLLKAKNPEEYLCGEDSTIDRTLPEYLFQLLDEHDVSRAEVARAAGMNGTFVYDIFQGKTHPSRDNAIKLAFGLRCSLLETQRLLRLAGVSELWPKVRRDAIVIWCVEQGLSRAECDDVLYRLKEKTLLDETQAADAD